MYPDHEKTEIAEPLSLIPYFDLLKNVSSSLASYAQHPDRAGNKGACAGGTDATLQQQAYPKIFDWSRAQKTQAKRYLQCNDMS